MPQPYRSDGHISIHPDSLLQRPRIAAIVAQSIGSFSRLALSLTNIFAAVLNVEEEIALEIYLAMRVDSTKASTFDMILRKRLSPTLYSQLSELRSRQKSLSSWRNNFCHDVWATADDLPHDILLIPGADAIRWMRGANFPRDAKATNAVRRPPADIYNERELGKYMESVQDLGTELTNLGQSIWRERDQPSQTL